jgi:hypothetical protein
MIMNDEIKYNNDDEKEKNEIVNTKDKERK